MTSASKGLVIRNTGNTYLVRDVDGNEFVSKAKGNLRLKGIRSTSPVVVGDIVFLDVNPDGTALLRILRIVKIILYEKHLISKHSHILASNIDLALLCITVRFPETTTVFIDRFLMTAEAYSVPVYLILIK